MFQLLAPADPLPAETEKWETSVTGNNFCVLNFTCGINNRNAFIIREHGNYPFDLIGKEIEGVYPGMMIVVGNNGWIVFRDMAPSDLVRLLKKLAKKVKLSRYQKHPRGPKKPQPKRIVMKNKPHVSTATILAERKK